jgi:hypothetical protein
MDPAQLVLRRAFGDQHHLRPDHAGIADRPWPDSTMCLEGCHRIGRTATQRSACRGIRALASCTRGAAGSATTIDQGERDLYTTCSHQAVPNRGPAGTRRCRRLTMMAKKKEATLADADEGKIRLSLIDVVYGLVIGYGFNFFVDKDPVSYTPFLFILVIATIVCDWLFVHKPYWREPNHYTNGPFVIDLCILFAFACMIRFAARPPYPDVLVVMSLVFLLYAIWDVLFSKYLRGRSWKRDFYWDLAGSASFFLLWKYLDVHWLASRVLYFDLPDWVGFDIDLRWWIVVAFMIYALYGPHDLGDWLKSLGAKIIPTAIGFFR